ncbi:Fe-S cluster assembly protein SufD [Brachybacterium endophyticum]|uniref:Fe-S cluster assembly protein SufD n=1 Tax=Brachybacterium endophyticum TaxID=2182385 RepID=A0A2U2RIY0_9MICO|nr:Fe-S cluster assembly protein SufD [Brachybacterium endophyticum]PWH05816.1 Fe-S cluster assembly protein SufD [Brachybacterium endophyticum]
MTSTDVKGPESAGDPVANEVVGGAAGAAPVLAQEVISEEDRGRGKGPKLEDEGIAVKDGKPSAATRGERHRSFDVAEFSRPTSKNEEWRFTPLRVLSPLFEDLATEDREGDPAVDYQVSVPEGAPEVGTLAPGQSPRGEALVPEDITSAVASARTDQALHLRAPRNAELAEPFRLTAHGRDAERRSNAHIVLQTEESSTATFVLDHTGSTRMAENVEMVVGDNSQMTVISLQNWEDDALHIATHHSKVGRDARLKHIVVSLGGRAVRVNAIGEFSAPGGELEKLGLYFADEKQFLEHRIFVDHAAPNCTSNSAYKGALQGSGARSVWVGDVLIRREAEGTSTYELNRNLVLTEGARADSVPNLEIETGEIEGAGHAAATGRFDDEQLFYLRARGIPELEARRLVVRGFFAELIQQIDVPEIRQALSDSIEDELQRSMN